MLGGNFNRLPLDKKANIVCANALTTDWASVLPPELCDYVIGNPPFVGAKFLNDAQRADVAHAFGDLHNAGLLDLVAAWYVKAARYVLTHGKASAHTRCAFVSTNSITQGEQVGVLWGWMLAQGIKIQFAHRTFQWSNDAKGVAAVHCVIIGFGPQEVPVKTIYEYPDIKAGPVPLVAKNINPYLVDAADVVLPRRSQPICDVASISKGIQPTDGGNLILSPEERAEFLRSYPDASHLIKRLIGAREFLHGESRYCLWLVNAKPSEIKNNPFIYDRVEKCRRFRAEDGVASDTIALAKTPTVFRETRNPASYVVVPSVSSERRDYIPFGFETEETIATNLCLVIEDAGLFDFGVLSSRMHNAWVRLTCGRLKSDLRYSKDIVYNNYPWPTLPEPVANAGATRPVPVQAASQKKRVAIEAAAQAVLDARASFPEASLADLYDPLAMPPALSKAHQQLDKAVDAAYAYKGQPDDASRVAFLFGLYEQMSSALAVQNVQRSKRSSSKFSDVEG